MAQEPADLDKHRGMSAQRDTEVRRRLAEVQADQAALKRRQQEFEDFIVSSPAASQLEAVSKAKYLIQLYAATPEGADPRRTLLIARALEDLDRLFGPNSDAE